MVALPSRLTVRAATHPEGKVFLFEAENESGTVVLSGGALHFA
jgi:hypothetical protein